MAVFLLGQGMGKTLYQATSVIVFWAINLMKAVPYALVGIFSLETFLADLILAPVALIGTWIGVRAHFIVPERLFFALTYLLLGVTGVALDLDRAGLRAKGHWIRAGSSTTGNSSFRS